MTETLTVNGVSLDTYAYMDQDISGLFTAPALRGENVVVPGRHGRIQTRNKRFDSTDLVLPLIVNGALPDGSIPGGSTDREEFYQRTDELLRLFYADPLTVQFTRTGGTPRAARCEVVDVMDFTRRGVESMARVSIGLQLIGAFWSDSGTVSQTVAGTTGTVQALTAFVGATAPMPELVLTFGPCNNPTLSHGGRFVTYNGVISAGRQLVINTANWTVSPGTGTAWSPDPRQVSFGPGPTWFELDPKLNPFQVTFAHTGGGSATCSISGKRTYLTP